GLQHLLPAKCQQLLRQGSSIGGCTANVRKSCFDAAAAIFRPHQEIGMPDDDSHDVVEVMGNTAGQSTDCLQLLHGAELLLQLHPFGDVSLYAPGAHELAVLNHTSQAGQVNPGLPTYVQGPALEIRESEPSGDEA